MFRQVSWVKLPKETSYSQLQTWHHDAECDLWPYWPHSYYKLFVPKVSPWNILLMEEILHHLRLVVFLIIYTLLHPRWLFGISEPSTVWNTIIKQIQFANLATFSRLPWRFQNRWFLKAQECTNARHSPCRVHLRFALFCHEACTERQSTGPRTWEFWRKHLGILKVCDRLNPWFTAISYLNDLWLSTICLEKNMCMPASNVVCWFFTEALMYLCFEFAMRRSFHGLTMKLTMWMVYLCWCVNPGNTDKIRLICIVPPICVCSMSFVPRL